ncbi:MAG: GTP 3',8-cyclase MoaA [Termitinemataceae bacterium]|nr:MAG: GTP 3',8-cyclase MoaA [Termitinemataceae bacterium]
MSVNIFKLSYSILKERPILLIFDVTHLCNQRCRMCNIWRPKSDDMSLQEIKDMAKVLADFGICYVFLQGGDPTVRKDLLSIVDIFLDAGIKPTVITNGILLKGEIASGLAGRPCNVAISLDTLNKKTFNMIRGVDAIDTVIDNIKAAAKLKKHGNWALTTTITELASLEDVKALERFANDNGYMYAIRPYIHTTETAGKSDDSLSYKDITRIVEIFQYMQSRARKKNYLASLIYDEHIAYIKGEPQKMCDALCRSMVMSPKGLFAPCIEFTGVSMPLQEMLEQKKIWLERCKECNKRTPCFYNDAREIGILWRKKWKVFLNLPNVVMQMIKYGNFF